MGSLIEMNDVLQITEEQGFPTNEINLTKSDEELQLLLGKEFDFHHKRGARIFHIFPNRFFLVQKVAGKWIFWGTGGMLSQTIHVDRDAAGEVQVGSDGKPLLYTSGRYVILKMYDMATREVVTRNDSPKDVSYFE